VAQRLLPAQEYVKLCKYENKSDRQLSLLGKLLLFVELENFGIPLKNLTSLTYNAFEKPHLNLEGTDVQFSISHSRTLSVVAISIGQRVGVDIEHADRIDLPEAASVFTLEEQDWISNDSQRFLTLWTRKEAILKAEGKGLNRNPHEVDVTKNATTIDGDVFHVRDVPISTNYACAVAFEEEKSTLILSHRQVDHLLLERISNKLL
jgi:4'-phosphopantetheinyl transferase